MATLCDAEAGLSFVHWMHYDASMAKDFLAEFMGNKARARLVRVFVFAPAEAQTAERLAKRAGIPLEDAEKEIKQLEQIGVVKKSRPVALPKEEKRAKRAGKKVPTWTFNDNFRHARALILFVHEIAPMRDQEIVETLRRSGRLAAVILSGTFLGDPTRPADLLVAGDALHPGRLERAIRLLEPRFGREIRYAVFSTPEFRYRLTIQDRLIRDILDYPHLVLLDRARILQSKRTYL